MLLIPPDSKRLTSARDGSAPGGFVRGGSGWPAAGVGRLTGRQCPKTITLTPTLTLTLTALSAAA